MFRLLFQKDASLKGKRELEKEYQITYLLYLSVSTRAVIGQFTESCSTVRPAKI